MVCVEFPEALFMDILEVEHDGTETAIKPDKLFIEICEPDSIMVASAVAPVPVGIKQKGDKYFVSSQRHEKMKVIVTLRGVRKGFKGRRFAQRTREEFNRNMSFWQSF